MKFTHVCYLVPGSLPNGALLEAAKGLLKVFHVPDDSVKIHQSSQDSHSVESRSLESLAGCTELAPGTALSLRSESAQFELRIVCLKTRVELALSALDQSALKPAMDSFCDQLGLARARCLALSFSGGGFRATLFHLGVLRFLAESGKLQDVTHICSVSGGSILAAHVVLNWQKYTGAQFDEAAAEIVHFAQMDVRGRVFRRWFMGLAAFPIMRFGPWPWKKQWTRTVLLQKEYDRLYRHELLKSLSTEFDEVTENPRPQVFLMATAMKSGDMCTFTGKGLQFEQAQLHFAGAEHQEQLVDGTLLPVAFAVSASSAFPPAFPPVKVTHQNLRTEARSFPQSPEYLSDGGVYDNLGIRKLQHLKANTTFDMAALVVSDAEAPFVWQVGKDYSAFWRRAVRSSDILMKRVANLEYDWAMYRHQAAETPVLRCSISEIVESTYALEPELVHATRQIRTDLDKFSDLEIRCLVRQGYMVARNALIVDHLFTETQRPEIRDRTKRPWDPTIPANGDGKRVDDTAVAMAAMRSRAAAQVRQEVDEVERNQRGSMRWITSLFSPADWVSWVSLCCLLLYAAMIGGSWWWNYVRASQAEAAAKVLAKESEDWQQDFSTFRYTFQDEDWIFRITYRDLQTIHGQLSERSLELIEKFVDAGPNSLKQLPSAEATIVSSYRRLKLVTDLESESARISEDAAYVSMRPILGRENEYLFTGFVPRFLFPPKDQKTEDDALLIQFYGIVKQQIGDASDGVVGTGGNGARQVTLDFFQYRLADPEVTAGRTPPGAKETVANFTVEFSEVANNEFEGDLVHPVLKGADGKGISIAKVMLKKEPRNDEPASRTQP